MKIITDPVVKEVCERCPENQVSTKNGFLLDFRMDDMDSIDK